MKPIARVLVAALVLLAPALAAAQAPGETAPPTDFRGKVTLAYGIVFGLVVVFILLSHRRNAALREEVEFLERRLDDLEKGGGAPR